MNRSRLRTGIGPALIVLAAWCAPVEASWQEIPSRQVVLFGVLATPGSTAMDTKIAPVVQAQLRRTLPGHGFKLIKVQSERVMVGQPVVCNLGDGFVTSASLLVPLDVNGKVQMRYELTQGGISQFQTIVVTPPDQFNFVDKMLPNNSHLLIGVGAR